MGRYTGLLFALLLLGFSFNASASMVDYNNFSDTSDLTLNGSATTVNNYLRLTDDYTETGTAFLTDPVNLEGDSSFSTFFQFQITDSRGYSGGADGLVFVLQNSSSFAIGPGGGYLGYPEIGPSIGIEFDTCMNSWDSNDNHIGINLNGSIDSVAENFIPVSLKNDSVWNTWIDYNQANELLEVRLSESISKPDDAQLSYSLNLLNVMDTSNVFIGFTSATYSGTGDHEILSWKFDAHPTPVPGAVWLFGSGILGLIGLRRKVK